MMAMPGEGAERKMGFWVNRKVAHMDERYSWPALPFAAARFMSALQPMDVPEVGRFAVVQDPQGAAMTVMAPAGEQN